MVAVLYRTNAQSRAIEDALMRDGIAYRIIGGVRFYERKEIKDVLAYLRLLINPHDDVSFRRVVNVPARGIGKSVLDALDAIDPAADDEAANTPLLSAGLAARADAAIALGAAPPGDRQTAGAGPRARGGVGVPRSHCVDVHGRRGRHRVVRAAARARPIAATCRSCATSAARKPRRASRT